MEKFSTLDNHDGRYDHSIPARLFTTLSARKRLQIFVKNGDTEEIGLYLRNDLRDLSGALGQDPIRELMT